jgi:hypothetical protein
VRVGQHAHVEHVVGIHRNAALEAKDWNTSVSWLAVPIKSLT